jgi:WD repeat-containing protein 19
MESDESLHDPKYLFRFYVAMKMYREAAKTAVIIAREEQKQGGYRIARDLLFGMHQELRAQRIRIPAEMSNNLMLIHSYLIARVRHDYIS